MLIVTRLQLAYNSVTVEGALALVEVVKNTPKTALEEINICVSRTIAQCLCFDLMTIKTATFYYHIKKEGVFPVPLEDKYIIVIFIPSSFGYLYLNRMCW